MFLAPSALASGSVFTAANMSVIGISAQWGISNPVEMYEMGLDADTIANAEEAIKSGQPISKGVAVDTFKFVYAADSFEQLPRSRVNDTLAKLTMIAEPRTIGSSIRSLENYPAFAGDFKKRFGDVIRVAQQITALATFDADFDVEMEPSPGMAQARWGTDVYFSESGLGTMRGGPDEKGPSVRAARYRDGAAKAAERKMEASVRDRLRAYRELIDKAIYGETDQSLTSLLHGIWDAHRVDLMNGGFLTEDMFVEAALQDGLSLIK